MKPCIDCKIDKDLSEFHTHHKMKDGRLNVCKSCHKKRCIKHREKNREALKIKDKERAKLPHRIAARKLYETTEVGKLNRKKSLSNWNKNHPQKRSAHQAVNNAIQSGKLVKKPCENCGTSDGVEAHHEDYSKPLEVVWLCDFHHKSRHHELKKIDRAFNHNGMSLARD